MNTEIKDNFRNLFELKDNSVESFNTCFDHLYEELNSIYTNDFNPDKLVLFRPIVDKFTTITNELIGEEEIAKSLTELTTKFVSNLLAQGTSVNIESKRNYYQNIFALVFQLKTKINRLDSSNELIPELIDPNYSDKEEPKKLIRETIELIKSSTHLSQKSINRIIKCLEEALLELDNKNPNWNNFYDKINKSIRTLGAIGAIFIGIEAGLNIFQAKEKLESTYTYIYNNSIYLTPKNTVEVFNFENPPKIENNKLKSFKLLEEK